MSDHQAIEQHRDLEGLSEFITGYFGETADSRMVAVAEAAWYRCMERRAAPTSEPVAVDRDAVLLAFGDWLNEPESRDESPDVRDYRFKAYRKLQSALVAPAAQEVPAAPPGYKVVPVEPTPQIIASAAIAAWPVASAADISMARDAAKIVLMQMDSMPGVTVDMLAATLATMAPAYRAMLAAAPEVPAPAPIQGTDSKDWTEDFAHENGNYQNKCSTCNALFMGHKRRVTCRECVSPAAIPDVMAVASRIFNFKPHKMDEDYKQKYFQFAREVQGAQAQPEHSASSELHRRAKGWQQCPDCKRLHAQISESSPFVQAHRKAEQDRATSGNSTEQGEG